MHTVLYQILYSILLAVTSIINSFYRKKVSGDYEALNDRLKTLPDQLSYDIMVSAFSALKTVGNTCFTCYGSCYETQYKCLSLVFCGLCFTLFYVFCFPQVPFGPLAFMPGKLVHTNEVTVLLGDNWFAKCSAKQAQKIVDHRMKCECSKQLHPQTMFMHLHYK